MKDLPKLDTIDRAYSLDSVLTSALEGRQKLASSKVSGTGELAKLVSAILLDLRKVTYNARLTHLTYFLEMACYEAIEQTAKSGKPPTHSPKTRS